METKLCRKCLHAKPLEEFYAHAEMRDGHLNKCKECTKADVREHRAANLGYYQNYDRQRYANDNGRRTGLHHKHNEHSRAWYRRNKEKKRANTIVARAIAAGKLIRPDHCTGCGFPSDKVEAHHADYSRPLDVEWLCPGCHGKTRRKPIVEMEPRKRGGYYGRMKPSRAA